MMNNKSKNKYTKNNLMKYKWLLFGIWTLLMGMLLLNNLKMIKDASQNLAIKEARTHFQKDKVFRYWSAMHGGFYVPITERTTPSSYLAHIPERDIQTPAGNKLTLMNPAWALRQMNEDFADIFGVVGHITSLQPLREENTPDDWEARALKLFENGESEVLEFIESGDSLSLRLIQPLITAEGCLKCHEHQGYKVGDIRGGVSVSVPLDVFQTQQKRVSKTTKYSFAILWILGIGAIIFGFNRINKNRIERKNARRILQESHDNLERNVEDRTKKLTNTNTKLNSEIVERKKAENLLKKTTERHSTMIENIGDVIVIMGADGITKYQSPNIEKWFGWKPDDLIGKNGWDNVHPEDIESIQKEFSKILKKETASIVEFRFKCKDGNYKWIELTAVNRINDPIIKGALLNYHDITERKLQETELYQHRNHLEELVEERNHELQAFANSVAHDINAPLRAIEGFTKALLEDYTSKLDEEGKHLGKVIQENSHKIGELIRGLRIFVGIGRKSMTFVSIDMKGMVKSMYYEVTNSKERERINLTIDDIPYIMADNIMLKQVWSHLIINAIKFSSKQDKSIISVSCIEEKDKLIYSIKDNGVGIDMKYHDDMFNLFRKLHVEREFEGHGVGLALAQRIIERHRGKVWAESEKDKGATFYFSLPIRKD